LNKNAEALPTDVESAEAAKTEQTPDIHTFYSIPMQYWEFIVAIAGYFATSYA